MSASVASSDTPLRDYAGNCSLGNYRYSAPVDIGELRELVLYANRENMPIRVRGHGHSMNGMAVPRPGELVISTENFLSISVDAPDRVTVGSGAAGWDVHLAAEALGLEMLVYNDGGAPASSLGGYLCAGGIGQSCRRYGGFWNTVESVTMVTGAGEVRSVMRGQPEFPWLFGSYGQLGIIADITLRVAPLPDAAVAPVVGTVTRVQPSHHDWESSAWFTLFVPQALWKVARTQLREICERHSDAWRERPLYVYPLPFRDFNPPLIHPYQGALVAIGVWGDARDGGALDWSAIAPMEADIQTLVCSQPDYRRYLQSEHISPGYDYRAHYGEAIWARFRMLKSRWDPKGLLAPGLFAN